MKIITLCGSLKFQKEMMTIAERGLQKQHCFVANERNDEVSKDAFDRMIKFIKQHTNI